VIVYRMTYPSLVSIWTTPTFLRDGAPPASSVWAAALLGTAEVGLPTMPVYRACPMMGAATSCCCGPRGAQLKHGGEIRRLIRCRHPLVRGLRPPHRSPSRRYVSPRWGSCPLSRRAPWPSCLCRRAWSPGVVDPPNKRLWRPAGAR